MTSPTLGHQLPDGSVSVPVYVMDASNYGRCYGRRSVLEQAALSPNPSRRSDAMTRYLVMKREARKRDWRRYHVGVVIVP